VQTVGATTENNMADQITPQMQDITRQRELAKMLLQKGMTDNLQGQMVSGRYVGASPWEGIAKVYSSYSGRQLAKEADKKQEELAKMLRQQGVQESQDILATLRGREARPEVIPQGQTLVDDQGMLTMGSQRGVTGIAPDLEAAYAKAAGAQTSQGQAFAPLLAKQLMPDLTPEEKRYKAAVADGSWKPEKMGGFNAFLNQMTEKDKASIANDRARLNLQQQEQAFNLGLPMPGVSGGVSAVSNQAPQTVAPNSPVLAQNQPPRFRSKAEQDIYVATQKEKGVAQAKAQSELPGALQTVQSGIDAIFGMIGDTTVDSKGRLVEGKTKPHPGFSGAVGISGIGSGFGAAGFIPGTDVKDFQRRFGQIEGQAFLGAINTLRGTGQITEIEGAKATAALNRMSLAQSEVEFVRAAREFEDVLKKGYKAAQQKAGVLPFNPNTQPVPGGGVPNAQPSPGGGLPKLRYDPTTGTFI
jgi:hypothetical protein